MNNNTYTLGGALVVAGALAIGAISSLRSPASLETRVHGQERNPVSLSRTISHDEEYIALSRTHMQPPQKPEQEDYGDYNILLEEGWDALKHMVDDKLNQLADLTPDPNPIFELYQPPPLERMGYKPYWNVLDDLTTLARDYSEVADYLFTHVQDTTLANRQFIEQTAQQSSDVDLNQSPHLSSYFALIALGGSHYEPALQHMQSLLEQQDSASRFLHPLAAEALIREVDSVTLRYGHDSQDWDIPQNEDRILQFMIDRCATPAGTYHPNVLNTFADKLCGHAEDGNHTLQGWVERTLQGSDGPLKNAVRGYVFLNWEPPAHLMPIDNK